MLLLKKLLKLLRLAALQCGALWVAGLLWAPPSLAQDAAPNEAEIECVSSPPRAGNGFQPVRDRGFLWRIQKAGRISYLAGTVHVGELAWTTPGPQTAKALKDSSVIALELDMMDGDINRRLQAAMAAAPRHALPEAVAKRLQAQVRRACLSNEVAQGMSPEMLLNTLIMLAARREGLDAMYGIDTLYAGVARRLRKPTRSLETPEEQLALIQGRTPAETLKLVEPALVELEGSKLTETLQRLTSDWAQSNFDDLSKYPQWCDCADTSFDADLQKRMLDDRNAVMAKKIDALHAGGQRVFAAVGSLHMIGPKGLPALMAARGYQVERVLFSTP